MVIFDLAFLNKYGLVGLLITTMLAYSVLPFPAEAAIAASAIIFHPLYVMLFALIGSTIGSTTNYYLGLKGVKKLLKKRPRATKKAKKLFEKYGPASLIFFGWFPLIGDPLVILSGSLDMNFWKFLIYSTIGKIFYFALLILFGIGIEAFITP